MCYKSLDDVFTSEVNGATRVIGNHYVTKEFLSYTLYSEKFEMSFINWEVYDFSLKPKGDVILLDEKIA